MYKIDIENGKYTFINDNGVVTILRHGENWDTGNKALLCLLQKVEKYEEDLNRISKAYEDSDENVLDEVLYSLFSNEPKTDLAY